MVISTGALIATAIIGALASAGVGIGTAAYNNEQQKRANQTNIELQNAANAQNQYNIEHAHQIEMADLEAAGLNPVLTATGGNGAPLTSIQAPTTKAPQLDLSSVNSAISGITNIMLISALMDGSLKTTGQNSASYRAINSSKQINSIMNGYQSNSVASSNLMRSLRKLGLSYSQARNVANYNIWR